MTTLRTLTMTFAALLVFSMITGCSSEKPVQEEAINNGMQMPERAEGSKPRPKVERSPHIGADCVDSSKIDLNEDCYDLYAPVCGCDSITYSNDCQARKSGVLSWTEGACK